MSRRTLSHFLNRDSDKKKSVLASTFSDFFLRRGSGKKKLCRLSEAPIFPMLTHGVLGVVPRLRRSLPRRAKRRNKSVLAGTRLSLPPRAGANQACADETDCARLHRADASARRSCRRTQSLEEAAQAPHGNASFSSAFPHLQYTRANPRVRTSAPSAARHSSCGVPASAKPRRGGTISAREAKPSADCAVPPALAPATHETRKQNHHSAKNSPETFRRARIRVFNTHISPSSSYAYPSFRYTSVTGFFPRTKKKAFPRKNPTGTLHEAEAKTP